MSILGNLFKKGQKEEDNFLALVLAPDRILTTIWTFEGDQVKPIGFGQKSYEDQDILIHQAAIAIDSAGEQAKVDIKRTVFGLCEYYLEEGSLTNQTTKTLKRLSSELELDPQAFVPLSAGINHLLKIEESQTPHAVLVGVFKNFCEVHLLENGKVVKTNASQSPTNIEKIKNLVNSLKEEDNNIPSRIVVYGLSESDDLAQKITKDDWNGIFANVPKVDFLDDQKLSRSIAYAQAADILGYDPIKQDAKEKASQMHEETSPKKANELGFVAGEDILLSEKPTAQVEAQEPPPEKEEVEKEMPQHQKIDEPAHNQEYALEAEEERPVPKPEGKSRIPHAPLPKFSALFAIFKLPKGSMLSKKIGIAALALILILVVGGFVFGQTQTAAEVVIKVNGQELQKDFEAKVQEGASLDKENSQIGARKISGKASGSQKAVTTGSKTLGDPAKGEVTVYNWTNSQKAFAKGTGIISKNGIKFALDGDVEVASRSASSPGEKNTSVVAQDVGPDGNLEAGQDFNFQEFDELSYSAINKAAFSGGAQRQTTVVTQNDIDRLKKSLLESLTEKAKEDLKNQAQSQNLQDDAVTTSIEKEQFDKALEEEASLLNLDMEVEISALVYSEDDLKQLLAEIFSNDVPDNLQLRPENIGFEDLNVTRDDDEMDIAGKMKAKLTPKFNEDELKAKIGGKSIKDARAEILNIQGVSQVEVNFKPNIPILSSIPRNKDKISFKVETI